MDEIFTKNINILKNYREDIWDSILYGTTAFLAKHLEDIIEWKDQTKEARDLLSEELNSAFLKEYYMTMVLLEKGLLKAVEKDLLSTNEEERERIKKIQERLAIISGEIPNREAIENEIRKEDPSTYRYLKSLGLGEERIQEIVDSGFQFPSILDEEPNSKLDK